jgi:hypothetical protein
VRGGGDVDDAGIGGKRALGQDFEIPRGDDPDDGLTANAGSGLFGLST